MDRKNLLIQYLGVNVLSETYTNMWSLPWYGFQLIAIYKSDKKYINFSTT